MWLDVLWWFTIALSVYLIGVSIYFRLWPHSAPAEAVRFMWCSLTHKPWHVVQKEADTLTRMYCTKCGHVHLKMKRREDYGKPARLPDDLRSRTKRPH
jgi:hypothetical protein